MKAVVAAFNQEKALVGAFSVITNLRMELSEALACTLDRRSGEGEDRIAALKKQQLYNLIRFTENLESYLKFIDCFLGFLDILRTVV